MKEMFSKILKFITVKFLLLILSIVLIGFSINYSFYTIRKFNDEKKEKFLLDSISKLKIWDTSYGVKGSGIDTVFLKTKYLDGRIYYRLWIDINKENGIKEFENTDKYLLNFADKDNFNLFNITLPTTDAIKVLDSFDTFSAFRFEGNKPINKKIYTQLKKYDILSSFK